MSVPPTRQQTGPSRSLATAVLGMEGLVVLIAALIIGVAHRPHALGWGVAVAVLGLLLWTAAFALHRRPGTPTVAACWVLLSLAVLVGLLSWPMWFLGACFAALFATAIHLQAHPPAAAQPPGPPRNSGDSLPASR